MRLLMLMVGLCAAPLSATEQQTSLPDALSARILDEKEIHSQLLDTIRTRVPMLPEPRSPEDWRKEGDRIRARVIEGVMLRGVPASWLSGPVKFQETGTISSSFGYTISKLRFEAVPGLWIPALLYVPPAQGRRPAVLHFEGHTTSGKAAPYKQTLNHRLSTRGYVVFSPDWVGLGELTQSPYNHNRLSYLDLTGVSGVSVFYLTVKRALEFLMSRPDVDAGRVAVTGLSGGGWQTIILSALDTRVALIGSVAGFIGLKERIEDRGSLGDLEQTPVDLHRITDYEHLTALLAPRPTLLTYNAKDDCCFPPPRAERSVYQPILSFFDLWKRRDVFEFYVNQDPGTHNYERDNQDQFVRFLTKHIPPPGSAPTGDLDGPAPGVVLPVDQTLVGVTKDNATFASLALTAYDATPRRSGSRRELERILKPVPIRFEVSDVRSLQDGSLSLRMMRFKAGAWTVPAVVIEPATPAAETVLLIADAGRKTMAGRAAELARSGKRVVAADLILHGDGEGLIYSKSHYSALLDTTGYRTLGIQASQLGALGTALKHPGNTLTLETHGERTSLAACVTAALYPQRFSTVVINGLSRSMRDWIAGNVFYNDMPELFCFGLAKEFDFDRLEKLAAPARIRR